MIVYFPDRDTLSLALTSGVVPPAVSLYPTLAGEDDDGHLWLQPSAALAPHVLNELRRLGVQVVQNNGALQAEEYACWLQIIPLRKESAAPAVSRQTPVLFDLFGAAGLPELVGEVLRLGNDRQGFRFLDGPDARVLLRVVGPPYYSLLRALDRTGPESPRAYVEQAPRVWVEIGHRHPLAEQIKPSPGKVLFMKPPCEWTFLDEAPFRDIYEILEFPLPSPRMSWQDRPLDQRLRVPLRLSRGGPAEVAELWVLRNRPVEQLDALVQGADDQLLARLSFAVAERDGQRSVILRVRPSKLSPPVLVLEAQGFRPYLKLPNLFVPCGYQVHPPLRRDAVRKLLADDPGIITWLYPHPDGSFTPESLPDEAFQPLSNWIDYILDHDREALQAWVAAARFDFEPFVCKDDQRASPKKPRGKDHRRSGRPDEDLGGEAPKPETPFQAVNKSRPRKKADDLSLSSQGTPSELQQRLHDLEQRFLEMKCLPDAPERQALWPELALLNTALQHAGDATVCWVNALWEMETPPPQWLWAWFQAETEGAATREVSGIYLDRLLATTGPSPADLRTLAACLAWSAQGNPPAEPVVERLGRIQLFLETHENLLPIRGIWLAWFSLVKLSQGDVLALARTRDRLLERLYQNGLSSDLDLPSFLRFSGQRSGERFRAIRDRVLRLRDLAREWIQETSFKGVHADPQLTGAYADLTFAFGLACLGEVTACQQLMQKAKDVLAQQDDVHTFLLEAYGYRVQQVLAGKGRSGPLPPEQLEYLEHMARIPRFKVDRLRENSRVLEPQLRESSPFARTEAKLFDPYRLWTGRFHDDLGRELAVLVDVTDRQQLANRISRLMEPRPEKARPADLQARILGRALELAPRIGEAFAEDLLKQVAPLIERLRELADRAALLEKALFLAAHFDRSEFVQQYVALFHQMLQAQRGVAAAQALDSLVGQCFRGLRKLGLHDEIDRFLKEMAGLILQGKDLADLRRWREAAQQGAVGKQWPAPLRTLLHVAAGWFYFGRDDQARPVVDETRDVLFDGDLPYQEQKSLACTYAATLGQAPVEFALARFEELFHNLERVHDPFTTNTHYSLNKLMLVEAVVLAMVHDDFALGTDLRRWLDDEEYLVRRRIHRDVRTLMAQAGL